MWNKKITILFHWLCFLLIALFCTLEAHNLSWMKLFVHKTARKRFLIQDPCSCISGFISELSSIFSILLKFILILGSTSLKRNCCAQLCHLHFITGLLTKALFSWTAQRDVICKPDHSSHVTCLCPRLAEGSPALRTESNNHSSACVKVTHVQCMCHSRGTENSGGWTRWSLPTPLVLS